MSSSIEQLLSKSLEDLYEELGRSLIAPEFPKTATITRQNAAQRGRSFVSGSLERLRAKGARSVGSRKVPITVP